MKYHMEESAGQRVKVAPTWPGLVAEFVGGTVVALPWCAGALTVFFLPDYLGAYRQDAALLEAFWRTIPVLVSVICVGYGLRRAMARAWVELDARIDVVRIQYRTLLGGEGELYELPLDAVSAVEVQAATLWHARQVVLRFDGGVEEVVARGWFVRAELDRVAEVCRGVAPAREGSALRSE